MPFRLFNALLALFHGDLHREESRDHAFGDVEVYIMSGTTEVGSGYFGGGLSEIGLLGYNFTGTIAHEIREKIPVGKIGRNDSTGPDEFSLGVTMPGLTKEAVLRELTS